MSKQREELNMSTTAQPEGSTPTPQDTEKRTGAMPNDMLDMKRTLQDGQGMTVHHSNIIEKISPLESNKLQLGNMEGLQTPIPNKEQTPRTESTKQKNKLMQLKLEVSYAGSDFLEEGEVECLVKPLKNSISFLNETDDGGYETEIAIFESIRTRSEKKKRITPEDIEIMREVVKDLEAPEYTKETNTPASSVKSSGYMTNNNRLEYNEERETSFNPFIQPNSMNRMTANFVLISQLTCGNIYKWLIFIPSLA